MDVQPSSVDLVYIQSRTGVAGFEMDLNFVAQEFLRLEHDHGNLDVRRVAESLAHLFKNHENVDEWANLFAKNHSFVKKNGKRVRYYVFVRKLSESQELKIINIKCLCFNLYSFKDTTGISMLPERLRRI